MALINISDWQFKKQHVQPDELQVNGTGTGLGDFVSSESIVLAAAPPASKDFSVDTAIPIGVCDTIQIGQNKTIQQLWEIGSREPFFIPGRTFINGAIGRVLFNGDSLLGALYESADTEGLGELAGSDFTIAGSENDAKGKFWLNLASDLFNRPFGMVLFMKDSEDQWVSAFFLENCFVQSHSLTVQSQQIVVGENVQFRCSKIVPINTQAQTTT
jgi:hypothetical protein